MEYKELKNMSQKPKKSKNTETTAKKATPTKTTAKKANPVKTAAKKATPTKTTAKKATPTKTAVKKTAPVKTAVKKSKNTETTAKKATPTKTAAKKSAPVKTAAMKATPTKTKAKNATPAKTTAKKAAPPKTETNSLMDDNNKQGVEQVNKNFNNDENIEWSKSDSFSSGYSKNERERLEKLYKSSLSSVDEKELVEAVVVGLSSRDVVVNIGSKSDGVIPRSEFRDMPDIKINDKVKVYIEEQENIKGQLILSRRKAKLMDAWDNIQKALDNDDVVPGFVKRRTKGGLIVDIYGIETFLPGSQIDVKPIRDYDIYVEKPLDVKIVKINYSNDNVVVSHKMLIEKDLEEQKNKILSKLEIGQVLEGAVKNMTNFGVFVDLGGGIDGLLHITDISWGRVNHPEEVLKLDEKINVVVLDYNDKDKRISLGMKQLTEHPWNSLDDNLDVGSVVKGNIVNVADYGAFLELTPGVEGLIHVSEMSWSQHLRNPSDFMKNGDELEAVVLSIDRNEKKMSLGVKQLTKDPWTDDKLLNKYSVGSTHKGLVRNLTNFGLFLELEEGIDGLVHVSDLSTNQKIKHPSEFIQIGENLEVVVMEQDLENRRLALSHKDIISDDSKKKNTKK
tara:strand:+ start:3792 stop:5651 length:1860 start_codon:yes stop_codon:yes gene_type:complete